MTRVVLTIPARPWTINQILNGQLSKWEVARTMALWRKVGWGHAMQAKNEGAVPFPGPVVVTCTPLQKNRRNLTDCGNVLPAEKGVIDGVVDSGLLPGDGPDVVIRLIFEAPRICGTDGLEVVIDSAS